METRVDFSVTRVTARGNWDWILRSLAPEIQYALDQAPHHVTCPVHGGNDGDGFRFFRDFDQSGGCICNSCVNPTTGKKGFSDGFETLAWLKKYSIKDAFQEVADFLGGHCVSPIESRRCAQKVPQISAEEIARKDRLYQRRLDQAWEQSIPYWSAQAEPLRRYFAKRGLDPDRLPDALRFHPSMEYWHKKKHYGSFPAILARLYAPDGTAITLHRTFITADGDKAPVPKPKTVMAFPGSGSGRLTGGAIRLFPAAARMGICEGIEDALAVWQSTGQPVWPCYSNVLLEKVVLPDIVEELDIWSDYDLNGAGQSSAEVRRLQAEADGLRARVHIPNTGLREGDTKLDWLEILIRHGKQAFPKAA